MKIPAHRIYFTEDEIAKGQEALKDIMSTGQMILGKYTEEFEQKYAELHGRKYGIAVASDTAGIEILLRIYGLHEGDQVLFPANGFFGIVIPILRCKATPFFFDMEKDTNLFATQSMVYHYLTTYPQIKVVILMHTGGLVASYSKEISSLCKQFDTFCIEDAAHAPGSILNGNYAGSFGDASVFSLYATKPLNAGEGGIILTDDPEIARLCKVYRNYGRESSFGSGIHTVEGYSWRLTEIQAAIGINQVKRQDEIRKERQQLAFNYNALVEDLREIGIHRFKMTDGTDPNWYRYLMMFPEDWTTLEKKLFNKIMLEEWGVQIPGDVYERLAHRQPLWRGRYDHLHFPIAQEWVDRHFALPLYNSLSEDEQYYIVKATKESFLKVEGLLK